MSKSRRIWWNLTLGKYGARVFARTFGGAVRTAFRNIRRQEIDGGVKQKNQFQLLTDYDTRGFQDVHGGPENEHVAHLGPVKSVAQILFDRASILPRRSAFRKAA